MIKKIYKSGKLRGDKVQYEDGVGCSIWYPWDNDEETGVCFDFPENDINDLINLLHQLKEAPAHIEG